MIQRERVADNVYSFQSDLYAQVTAGAVIGPSWAIVIDTLALPEETLAIREYIEQELGPLYSFGLCDAVTVMPPAVLCLFTRK